MLSFIITGKTWNWIINFSTRLWILLFLVNLLALFDALFTFVFGLQKLLVIISTKRLQTDSPDNYSLSHICLQGQAAQVIPVHSLSVESPGAVFDWICRNLCWFAGFLHWGSPQITWPSKVATANNRGKGKAWAWFRHRSWRFWSSNSEVLYVLQKVQTSSIEIKFVSLLITIMDLLTLSFVHLPLGGIQ